MFVSTSRFWFRIEFEKCGLSMISSKINHRGFTKDSKVLHFAFENKPVAGEP